MATERGYVLSMPTTRGVGVEVAVRPTFMRANCQQSGEGMDTWLVKNRLACHVVHCLDAVEEICMLGFYFSLQTRALLGVSRLISWENQSARQPFDSGPHSRWIGLSYATHVAASSSSCDENSPHSPSSSTHTGAPGYGGELRRDIPTRLAVPCSAL